MEKKFQEKKIKLLLNEMDKSNMLCIDCKNTNISYVSINNGVIICENCAKEHKKLGTHISYIREISDKWDDYLMSFVRYGSNTRFMKFEKDYHIDKLNIAQKYCTRAAEYYRAILRSEVIGFEPPDNINLRTAAEVIEIKEDYYPEFKNYTFVKHIDFESIEKKILNEKKEKENNESFFNKLTYYIGNGYNYAAEAYNGNKNIIIEKGTSYWNGIKNWWNNNDNNKKEDENVESQNKLNNNTIAESLDNP